MFGSILRVRRWFGLCGLSLLLAVGSAVSLPAAQIKEQAPLVYALLLIEPAQPALLPAREAPADKEEFARYRKNQVVMLKSRLVLNGALREPKVAELPIVKQQTDPVRWLEENLLVGFPGNDTILRVGMHGDQTEEIVLLVNAVVESYLHEIIGKGRNDQVKRLDTLKTYRVHYEDQLHKKRNNLRDLAKSANSSPADPELARARRGAFYQELVELKREHLRLRLALTTAKVRQELEIDKDKVEARKIETAILTAQEKLVREEIEKVEKRLAAFEQPQVDLTWLREEIVQKEGIVRRLGEQITNIELEMDAPPRVRLLQPARALGGK